jgi:hypothetical protein
MEPYEPSKRLVELILFLAHSSVISLPLFVDVAIEKAENRVLI